MLKLKLIQMPLLAALLLGAVGCEQLPGNRKSQGAAVGGLGGAAVGAAVGGEKHRLLGALLGGVLGAGGGYVIAAKTDRISNKDTQGAQAAATKAQTRPATAQEALNATTADVNRDGFVTLDEVIAMKQAGLSDDTMIQRLRATDQVFELTDDQKRQLANQGVSGNVVNQMATINQDKRQQLLNPQGGVISRPSATPQ